MLILRLKTWQFNMIKALSIAVLIKKWITKTCLNAEKTRKPNTLVRIIWAEKSPRSAQCSLSGQTQGRHLRDGTFVALFMRYPVPCYLNQAVVHRSPHEIISIFYGMLYANSVPGYSSKMSFVLILKIQTYAFQHYCINVEMDFSDTIYVKIVRVL